MSLQTQNTFECFASLLPVEILALIFRFLPHSDQVVCRRVCRHWLQASEVSSFRKQTILRFRHIKGERLKPIVENVTRGPSCHEHFHFRSVEIPLGLTIWSQPVIAGNIISLEFVDCELNEKDTVLILAQLTRLRRLLLVNCRDVFISGNFLSNTSDLECLQASLANLTELVLDSNRYLSDVLIMRIASIPKQLQLLSVSDCNIMNDPGIYAKHYPTSQGIKASPSVLTWRIMVQAIRLLADSITSLNVSCNSGIDLKMLSDIPGLDLRCLNISYCSSVTYEGFSCLLAASPNLIEMNISNCRRIFSGLEEESRWAFSKLNSVKTLAMEMLSTPYFKWVSQMSCMEHLNINNLDAPGSQIIFGMQDLNTGRLRSLSAKYLSVDSQDLCTTIDNKNWTNLRRLDLSYGCQDVITDAVLQCICLRMPELTHLNLEKNPLISDVGTLGLKRKSDDNSNSHTTIPLGSKAEQAIRAHSVHKKRLEQLAEEDRSGGLLLLTKLTHLNLGYTAVTGLTLTHGLAAPDLRSLKLNGCVDIGDEGLYDCATRHSRIEQMELQQCWISDTGLISFLSCLPRLVYLDLSFSQQITCRGVKAMGQVCPQLRDLMLVNCPEVRLETAKHLESVLTNLRTCEVRGLRSTKEMSLSGLDSTLPPPPPPPPILHH